VQAIKKGIAVEITQRSWTKGRSHGVRLTVCKSQTSTDHSLVVLSQ
jgi:hypothetical protein